MAAPRRRWVRDSREGPLAIADAISSARVEMRRHSAAPNKSYRMGRGTMPAARLHTYLFACLCATYVKEEHVHVPVATARTSDGSGTFEKAWQRWVWNIR